MKEAAALIEEYDGAVGLAGWSNLGSELPESVQAKVRNK